MTYRADFSHLVRPSKQSRRAGKKFAPKIDTQPITHYRNVKIIDRFCQLPDLLFLHEMGFVDKNTGHRPLFQPRLNLLIEVITGQKRIRIRTNPDTARNASFAAALIKGGEHKIGNHTALTVVMRRLQEHC